MDRTIAVICKDVVSLPIANATKEIIPMESVLRLFVPSVEGVISDISLFVKSKNFNTFSMDCSMMIYRLDALFKGVHSLGNDVSLESLTGSHCSQLTL